MQQLGGKIKGNITDQTDLKNALDNKQSQLISGENIKTINNQSILGTGNIDTEGGITTLKTINNETLEGTGNIDLQVPLVSGTNIKTINNQSILGTGNIDTEGGTDTGWVPLTLGSDVTGYSWASPVYRKIGNIVSVQGVVKASSLTSGNTTICTLPYGGKTEYGIGLRTGNGIQPFSLRPSGILAPNYSATNVDIWLSFTYMIA